MCTVYFSRYAFTKSVKFNPVNTVAKFLFEDVLTNVKSSSILQSDRDLGLYNVVVAYICNFNKVHWSVTADYNN